MTVFTINLVIVLYYSFAPPCGFEVNHMRPSSTFELITIGRVIDVKHEYITLLFAWLAV